MPTTTAPTHSFPALRDGLKTSLLAGYPELDRAARLEPRPDRRPPAGPAGRPAGPRDRALPVPCAPAAWHRPGRGRRGRPLAAAGDDQDRDDGRARRRLHRPPAHAIRGRTGPRRGGAGARDPAGVLPRPHHRRQLGPAGRVRARPAGRGAVLRLADPGPGRASRGDGRSAAGWAADRDGRGRLARPRHRHRRAVVRGRDRAAVQFPRGAGHATPVRHRRAAQRPPGGRALRLPHGAGAARPGAGGRPAADLADGDHEHQRDVHPRAARGDHHRVRGSDDRQLRLHGRTGRCERARRRRDHVRRGRMHRRAGRRAPSPGPTRYAVGGRPRHEPEQPAPAAHPLRADRHLRAAAGRVGPRLPARPGQRPVRRELPVRRGRPSTRW